MKPKRIRQINILELDQALYSSTYEVGLEMANWLNASMHVCMLESFERKSLEKGNSNSNTSRSFVEDIINDISVKGELINLGVSFDQFDEKQSIKEVFGELSLNESLSILGYNKSPKHKEVLKKLIKNDLGNPLLLVPMGKELENFHKIIVPFDPEYVTKKKLSSLKWISDQLGLMIEFVHFKQNDTPLPIEIREICEVINYWIEDLGFNANIQFDFPYSMNLNEGLKTYLAGRNNYLLCIIDKKTKSSISLASSLNEECLMDIKEPVVVL